MNNHKVLEEYKWKVIEEVGLFFERRLNITEVQDNIKDLFANLELELKDNAENTKSEFNSQQTKSKTYKVEEKDNKTELTHFDRSNRSELLPMMSSDKTADANI